MEVLGHLPLILYSAFVFPVFVLIGPVIMEQEQQSSR